MINSVSQIIKKIEQRLLIEFNQVHDKKDTGDPACRSFISPGPDFTQLICILVPGSFKMRVTEPATLKVLIRFVQTRIRKGTVGGTVKLILFG